MKRTSAVSSVWSLASRVSLQSWGKRPKLCARHRNNVRRQSECPNSFCHSSSAGFMAFALETRCSGLFPSSNILDARWHMHGISYVAANEQDAFHSRDSGRFCTCRILSRSRAIAGATRCTSLHDCYWVEVLSLSMQREAGFIHKIFDAVLTCTIS